MAASRPSSPSRSSKPRKSAPRKPAVADSSRGLAARIYLFLAHAVGGAARAFSINKIAPEERRDGFPFAIFIAGILGAWVAWFMPAPDGFAHAVHSWTMGLMFGRVSLALPVLMIVVSIYLMRFPSTVKDNGRIVIGLFLLVVSASGFFHICGMTGKAVSPKAWM